MPSPDVGELRSAGARAADDVPVARPRPVLVTGSHRSGTGWVGQMLASGPTPVGYVWEPFSLQHRPGTFAVRVRHWFPYVCEENAAPYRRAVEDLLAWRYRPLAELRAARRPHDLVRLGRDWRRFAARRRSGAVPLLKDPIAVFSAEWLERAFDLSVVVIVRHPAAFAASIKRLGWTHPFSHFLEQPLLMRDLLAPHREEIERYASGNRPVVDQAILLWILIHDVLRGYRERHPGWAFARLEDLSREPVAHFRGLFEHLGLRFDERVEARVRETTDARNPVEAHRADSIHRHSAAHVWNWKRTLTSDEVVRVRERTEPLASHFYGDEDW
jgi:hypothetical protein